VTGAELGVALAVFLACAVEAVEALTIVLALGTTRGWSSALAGAGAAVLALAVVVAGLGPAITSLPLDTLRVLIGGLLLIFGLQWLRKAILRWAGLKEMHDELLAFEEESEAAREHEAAGASFDGYAFTVCFKGVLLEGLEVAFIVLTVGANQHRLDLAAAAALAAVVVVIAVGAAVRAPLARVPENTLKLLVGVMLTSFGIFWSGEGAGADWPGGEAALLVIIPAVLLCAWAMATTLSRAEPGAAGGAPPERPLETGPAQAADSTEGDHLAVRR
jgi:uncharacterized membrane protein